MVHDCIDFPDWKISIVSPIQKSGLLNKIQNHRPIFIMSPLCLALERELSNLLANKFVTSFNSAQSGFAPKKSLVTQLMAYIEKVLAAVDSADFRAAAYFDFDKVFDAVPTLG